MSDSRISEAVTAVVALGSNLGDRHELIRSAVSELHALPETTQLRVAEPQETIAVTSEGENPDAPRYLNTVAIMSTRLTPVHLWEHLQRIENQHGRVRRQRWGDRTLDLDLIAWGEHEIVLPELTVPHPRAAERTFVLEPWLRLDPAATLPGHGTVADALDRLVAQRHSMPSMEVHQ